MTTPPSQSRRHAALPLSPNLRHLLDVLPPTDRFHAVRHLHDAVPLPPHSSSRLHNFIKIYTLIKTEPREPPTRFPHIPLPIPKATKMQTRSQTAHNPNPNQPPPTTPPPTSRQPLTDSTHASQADRHLHTTSRSSHQPRHSPTTIPDTNTSSATNATISTTTPSNVAPHPLQTIHPTTSHTQHQHSSSNSTTTHRRHSVPTDVNTPTFKSPENTLKHPSTTRHHNSNKSHSRSSATVSYPDITPPTDNHSSTLDAILRHTPRKHSSTVQSTTHIQPNPLDFSSHNYSTPTHSPRKHSITMAPTNPFQPDATPATFDDIIHETHTSTVTAAELRQFPTIPDNQLNERLVRNLLDRLVTLYSQDSSREIPCREATCIRKLSSSFHWRKLTTWLRSYLDKSIHLTFPRSEYWARLYDFYHPYCFTPRPEQLDLATALSRISDRLTPENNLPPQHTRPSRYRPFPYPNSQRPNQQFTPRPPYSPSPSYTTSRPFNNYTYTLPNTNYPTFPPPRPPINIPITPNHLRPPHHTYNHSPTTQHFPNQYNHSFTPRSTTTHSNRPYFPQRHPGYTQPPRPPNQPNFRSPPINRHFRNTQFQQLDTETPFPHSYYTEPIPPPDPIIDTNSPFYTSQYIETPSPPSPPDYCSSNPTHEQPLFDHTNEYTEDTSPYPPFDLSMLPSPPDTPTPF